jgi:GNAT superfamily N-acetyltransferase
MADWVRVAAEYPKIGPAGISYFRGVRKDGHQVNCLLYREEDGELTGVLTHHPTTIPNLERRGQGNLWVHPEHRRQGIARKLLLELVRRDWPTDHEQVRTTPEGAALLVGLIDELRPDPPDVGS